ncbi:MAG TPA: phosphatase PAP2 family protein [Thermoleophilaceae bacterium]|nr:phosphatase PAP2 family protein [Thermoleophilaceae bacterium]
MRPLAALDLRLLRLLRTRGHTPAVEAAVLRLAQAGENGLLWYVIALVGVALGGRRRRQAYFRAVKIVLATLVANTVVKQTVRRARPVLEEELPALTPVLSGRSYPSAHSSTSFAGARALSAAGMPAAPLYAVAVAMALSRPYLGVHYPSDIAAGALLGDAMGRLMTP